MITWLVWICLLPKVLSMLLLAGEKLPREVFLLSAHTSPSWAFPPASCWQFCHPPAAHRNSVFSANGAAEVLLPCACPWWWPGPARGGSVCDRCQPWEQTRVCVCHLAFGKSPGCPNEVLGVVQCCSMVMFTNDLRFLAPFPIPFPSPTSFPLFYFLLLEA